MKASVVSKLSRFLLTALYLATPLPGPAVEGLVQTGKAAVSAGKRLALLDRPLVFEPFEQQEAASVGFAARGRGYSFFLSPCETVLVLSRGPESSPVDGRFFAPPGNPQAPGDEPKFYFVRMKMVGGLLGSGLHGRRKLPSKSHYFLGNDPARWRTNVTHYARVEHDEIYPGVGLVFYGNQGQLEYDFLVAPGADPGQIKLGFEGADELSIKADGDLVLKLDNGEVVLHKPIVYQENPRQSIEGRFVLESPQAVGFEIGAYDPTRRLVIDPVLTYSTFLGGSSRDSASAIAVDAQGNAYVTGYTESTNFPTLNSPPSNKAYPAEAFVTKFDAAGQLVYSTYLGGQDIYRTSGAGIAVDAAGNAYVTGYTGSTNFPTINAFQPTNAGAYFSCITKGNAFVTKLNASGSGLLYSTYLGGSAVDYGNAIAVDSLGNVYVTGQTYSTNFPTKAPLFPNSGAVLIDCAEYRSDVFVTKLSPGGSDLVFSTYLGGSLSESGSGIAVDPSGNVLVTGSTSSSDFPTLNAFQNVFHPVSDAFVTKFNATADALIYSTFLGGKAWLEVTPWILDFGTLPGGVSKDLPFTLKNTSTHSLTITELKSDSVFLFPFVNPPTVPFTLAPGEAVDITVHHSHKNPDPNLRLDNLITIKAQREEGTVRGDSGFTVQIATITGYPPGTFKDFDRDLSNYDGAETGADVAVDKQGNAYVAGSTGSRSFPIIGGVQTALGNPDDRILYDAFVTKFDPTGTPVFSTYLGGSGHDLASGIAVDEAGRIYVGGETYSTNFPLASPVQPTYPPTQSSYDGFVATLDPNGSTITDFTYLGGIYYDAVFGIALDPSGGIYVAGVTYSTNFPTLNAAQPIYGGDGVGFFGSRLPGDAFVAKLTTSSQRPASFQVWQRLQLNGHFSSTSTNDVRVQFIRTNGSTAIIAEAPILRVTPTNVTVRVPVNLLGPSDVLVPPSGVDTNIVIHVVDMFEHRTNVLEDFVFLLPRPLIVDEVFVPPPIPAGGAPQAVTTWGSLLQFQLTDPARVNNPGGLATFVYLGRSTDGVLALRTLNTALPLVRPLQLEGGIAVFQPTLTPQINPVALFFDQMLPFTIPNLGFGDEGKEFNVSRNGLYVFVVEPDVSSPGPFPAPFQVHLAGNVGLPRKLVNTEPEFPRGTRLDTLFNHPAPRPQILAGQLANAAQTDLFKFANRVSVSQFAVAVLIPPTPNGFTFGTPIVRSPDPAQPLGITTPTARTPGCFPPLVGTVIDFTQVPIPMEPGGLTTDLVLCAALGVNDQLGPQLPTPLPGGGEISSLILDMGSGQEIVDGTGADFRVFALSGSYSVAVGNTPYTNSFVLIPGTFSGTNAFDLASTGLSSARYVRVTAAPSVVLDAVQAINVFADEMLQNQVGGNLGPFIRNDRATITVRRSKDPVNPLDPFMQLITPSGTLAFENESGFGDDLSPDLSDSALRNIALEPEFGFFRWLVKGYDKQPDEQAFGSFFTRLETGGVYDQAKIIVSDGDEATTAAEKTGTISTVRQRDSFLFHATPGQSVNIVVNGRSLNAGTPALPNPVVELYDPEDFLIAANDDYDLAQRGRNPVLSLVLPAVDFEGTSMPNPSTYRIVVSGIDTFANQSPLATGAAHIRSPAGGGYEVKVFTGNLAGPGGAPRIDAIIPGTAIPGAQVTITGANFSSTVSSNVVMFGTLQATVLAASGTQLAVIVPQGASAGSTAVTVRVGEQTSAPLSFQIAVPVARTAAARLNCFSLRFPPANVSFLGQPYTLELTSLSSSSPPNGELYPQFDPFDFSHTSDFLLRAANPANSISGFLYVDVPTPDPDHDGVADFFQASHAVVSAGADGEYFTTDDDGLIAATWDRPAGSTTGTCHLVLTSSSFGPVGDFSTTFELLEYSGPLTYTTEGSNVTTMVSFTQTQNTSNALAGSILFTRSSTNRFNQLHFSAGLWTNTLGQSLNFDDGVVQRLSLSASNYFGRITFLDGDPATTGGDYFDWALSIHDTNDTNANGIPNFSDDPSIDVRPVFSAPRVEGGKIVLEWQGTGKLQSASGLAGPWTTITNAVSPSRQDVIGEKQFFRIAP